MLSRTCGVSVSEEESHSRTNAQDKNEEGKPALKVDVWFGKRATLAAIRTLCSHVQNMIGAYAPLRLPHRRALLSFCLRAFGLT